MAEVTESLALLESCPGVNVGTRIRVQWIIEELLANGLWSRLSQEEREQVRTAYREKTQLGVSSVQRDFQVASLTLEAMTGDRDRVIAIHQTRLDYESQTAAEAKDRIAASKVVLQSMGALNSKRIEEDPAQLSDKQFEHRMVQAIRTPDKNMQRYLRAAFADPGEGLKKILNEWLESSSTTTEGESV